MTTKISEFRRRWNKELVRYKRVSTEVPSWPEESDTRNKQRDWHMREYPGKSRASVNAQVIDVEWLRLDDNQRFSFRNYPSSLPPDNYPRATYTPPDMIAVVVRVSKYKTWLLRETCAIFEKQLNALARHRSVEARGTTSTTKIFLSGSLLKRSFDFLYSVFSTNKQFPGFGSYLNSGLPISIMYFQVRVQTSIFFFWKIVEVRWSLFVGNHGYPVYPLHPCWSSIVVATLCNEHERLVDYSS